MSDSSSPDTREQSVSLRKLRWLHHQVQQWVDSTVISGEQAQAILCRYESTDDALKRRARRAFIAVCAMAVLMFAVGVLLLIGYNWDRIPRDAKVAMVFSVVAAAFAASAITYARGRPLAGELLALAATLLYGNAIWLLAQVFHIQSHYPDGLMWWMIGALITAHLLRSRLNGIEAIILLAFWAGFEGWDFARATYWFLPFAALSIWLAYRLCSVVVLLLAILALGFWLLVSSTGPWQQEAAAATLMLTAGCAYYAAGLLHPENAIFRRAWQIIGLVILMIAVLPFTFEQFYEYFSEWHETSLVPLLVAVAALLFSLVVFARPSSRDWKADWPLPLAAVMSLIPWLMVLAQELWPEQMRVITTDFYYHTGMAIAFNALVLAVAIWLIARGMRLDRALSFFAGVIYLLVLVLVRWIDLIGDMLSSAMLFFIAGAVLLITAHFWRKRHALTPSTTELDHA